MDDQVFVLLDDCKATAGHPASRLYTGYAHLRVCADPQTLDTFWQEVEADMAAGLHAAVFADYEWGARLLQAGHQSLPANSGALRVLLFRSLQTLSAPQVEDWLARRDGSTAPSVAGVMALEPSVTRVEFEEGIHNILALIRAGETYQVNYTYRLQGQQFGTPTGLYRRLRAKQPVSFGCLAALPAADGSTPPAQDQTWVVSCSPELFVRNEGGHLTTRPMKGTAPRDFETKAEDVRGHWLSQDPKNLAENVMIVDLLRNDLGRISEIGSVKVPKLFAVETYGTVHQMTSTVESRIRPGLRFPDVLRALFPCGSITGTPKVHTMDLIAGLESTPRGLYCGAIGWLDAPVAPALAGDFCLSVAIRTLQLGPEFSGQRPATLGVGSGVVMDSNADDEYAEIQTKARFITAMDPGFTLFETMRVSRNKIHALAQHLHRLKCSAQSLGFHFDEDHIQAALSAQLKPLDPAQTYRMRLDLHHDGGVQLQHAELLPLPEGPARLVLSASPVQPAEAILLNYKTSLRGDYDAAIRKAMALGAFDTIFVNAAGEICEGARSNLLVNRQGRWITPPLASGVLPGVMRTRLLKRFTQIEEKVLNLDTALKADALLVCSALRGIQRAEWLRDAAGRVVQL